MQHDILYCVTARKAKHTMNGCVSELRNPGIMVHIGITENISFQHNYLTHTISKPSISN